MIYLDYSATTKADKKVLDKFWEVEEKYFANPNSSHELGASSKREIDKAIDDICSSFNIDREELIFTSGASESNNMVLKGINVSHIITTKLEHSSIITPVGYLQSKGIRVDFVKLDENGIVDFDNLKQLIDNDNTLVSIGLVNSETGIRQPIEEIGKLLSNYSNVTFHSDITQAVGKIKFDLNYVDLASFSMHKIFGFKGIGALIKKKNVKIIPLIHGGKSTSIYRSGTPQTGLIVSSSVAVLEAFSNLDDKIKYVSNLNNYLRENIKDLVIFNSNDKSIPNILNFSLMKNADETLKYFSDNDIYISSRTACSNGNYSAVVYELYHDLKRSENSIRVSLSYKTTMEELDAFIRKLKEYVR